MPTIVVLATADTELANAWERQLSPGRTIIRLGAQEFPSLNSVGFSAVVILDAAAERDLPAALVRCPTIYIGEPRSAPFEQAKMAGRAKAYLSYEESNVRLRDLLPLVEELAEKQSMFNMVVEMNRRPDQGRPNGRAPAPATDAAEWWDFFEGVVENLDSRDRLTTEFRRASRLLLHASHTVFFLREADLFRADRGTSFFPADDPIVAFFENHPAIIDANIWEVKADPVAELAVRNRLALWGARVLVPVHDNGRLLGLIALGVRDDGQHYDEADRTRAVFFARLLRLCLAKASQLGRLNQLSEKAMLGAKYLPNTLVLAPDEGVPRHVPLVVRDLIGQVQRKREISRVAPSEGQPFRAAAGMISETGGIWASWEEASAELHDAAARQRVSRRGLLREIGLTLSHEVGNALVSLATLRQFSGDKAPPPPLLETALGDVAKLEALYRQLSVMQTLHEADGTAIDLREMVQAIGDALSLKVEIGPDPVRLVVATELVDFAVRSLVSSVAENRPGHGMRDLILQVRSTGDGGKLTALLSIKGRLLELEGILPEPEDTAVPNQGRLGVFLAKEILRLHHGEIHAGPGLEGTEILISLRSL